MKIPVRLHHRQSDTTGVQIQKWRKWCLQARTVHSELAPQQFWISFFGQASKGFLMLRSATDLQWPFIWSNSREREKGAMCFQMEKHKCDCVTERKLNRLPLGQTREKNIALSEYNKNTSSRIDDYRNEQIPWQTLQRQWVIKRCVLRTCSRPTSGIPAYAATDFANESVPGPNNMIFFGSWVRNSWRTFCPNPKLPFGKKKFFTVITKKIALYQYDTSSHPSRWHDLHWLLSRWYKSPPSPMPCTMYV